MIDVLAILLILVGLELVLGGATIPVIAILVGRLPDDYRRKARMLRLSFALVALVLMPLLLLHSTRLTGELVAGFSGHDLIILSGGFFLI